MTKVPISASTRRLPALATGIGMRLMARTLGGQILQSVLLIALVGLVIVPSMQRLHGDVAAAVAAGLLTVVVLTALAFAVRSRVGRQHLFLLVHGPKARTRLWGSLVWGETLAFLVVALCVYLLLIVRTADWQGQVATWVIAGLLMEWALYLVLAAHLLGTTEANDEWLRSACLLVAGPVLLAGVIVKGIAIGYVTSPWVVPVQAVLCGSLGVRLASRAPFTLQSRTSSPESPR